METKVELKTSVSFHQFKMLQMWTIFVTVVGFAACEASVNHDIESLLEDISENWEPMLIGTGCYRTEEGEGGCTHSLGFFPQFPNEGQKKASYRFAVFNFFLIWLLSQPSWEKRRGAVT